MESKYDNLRKKIMAFRDARDWAQYHDPKNLASAISIEAAELQEIFLWLSTQASRQLPAAKIDRVKDEVADIFIFLNYLCDALDINLFEAAEDKLAQNALKYPVALSKGSNRKYTDL